LRPVPVARNVPRTFPSESTVLCSNTKMSCIVMTSFSMPEISETATTRRVPSMSRSTWMTRSSAREII
jgi:hypothetical protein